MPPHAPCSEPLHDFGSYGAPGLSFPGGASHRLANVELVAGEFSQSTIHWLLERATCRRRIAGVGRLATAAPKISSQALPLRPLLTVCFLLVRQEPV